MADLKRQITALMERHEGRQQAITRREIRHLLEIPYNQDRKLRLTIAELRHEGLPILFATSKPAGYYLPRTLRELKEGTYKLRSYVIDECIILRDLKVKGQQYVQGEAQGKLL